MEQKLKNALGEQAFVILVLQSQLEDARSEIDKLRAQIPKATDDKP